jgi:hypothetical protein
VTLIADTGTLLAWQEYITRNKLARRRYQEERDTIDQRYKASRSQPERSVPTRHPPR